MSRKNPTHLRRAARAIQAAESISYLQALERARQGRTTVAGRPDDVPGGPCPAGIHPQRWQVTYQIRSLNGPGPTGAVVREATVIVNADDAQQAALVAVEWVHANDVYCDARIDPTVTIIAVDETDDEGGDDDDVIPSRSGPDPADGTPAAVQEGLVEVFFVESGSGDRLSGEFTTRAPAHQQAEQLGERLIRRCETSDGTLVDETLEVDFAAGPPQSGRAGRQDLCEACMQVGHDICNLDPRCSCCAATLAGMD